MLNFPPSDDRAAHYLPVGKTLRTRRGGILTTSCRKRLNEQVSSVEGMPFVYD